MEVGVHTRQTCFVGSIGNIKFKKKGKHIKQVQRQGTCANKDVCFKNKVPTRAVVAQWTERRPVNLRVAGLIPSQGTCLGYGPGPQ